MKLIKIIVNEKERISKLPGPAGPGDRMRGKLSALSSSKKIERSLHSNLSC